MDKNNALLIAGIIFCIVALAHLVRLIYNAEIIVANYSIPMWASWLAFLIALILAVYMLMARKT